MKQTAREIIAEWRASNLNNDDGELASRFNLWLMQQLQPQVELGKPIPATINGEPGRVAFFTKEAANAYGFGVAGEVAVQPAPKLPVNTNMGRISYESVGEVATAQEPADEWLSKWLVEYWTPIVKRPVLASEFNETDMACYRALIRAAREASHGE